MKTIFLALVSATCGLSQVSKSTSIPNAEQLSLQLSELREGQSRIEKTLRLLEDRLSGKPPLLEDVSIDTTGAPAMGDSRAMVAIVQFTDFQCPFCGAYARDTFPQLVSDYIATGKLRYYSFNFPLEEIHPRARDTAKALLCAEEQKKYWPMHEWIFSRRELPRDIISESASIGIDPIQANECLGSGDELSAQIDRDISVAKSLGVAGTPTFFVGYVDRVNGAVIRATRSFVGATPLRELKKAIDEALSVAKEKDARN